MKWCSPLVMVGTEADAEALNYYFIVDNPFLAARQVEGYAGVVVPTTALAGEVLELLGAPQSWVHQHVDGSWALDPTETQ